MKGKSYFGYKFLFFIALAAAIASAAARGYRPITFDFSPDPDTTTATTDTVEVNDTLHKLRFPIYDKTGDPMTDYGRPKSIDLDDPSNVQKSIDFDADSNRYNFSNKLGSDFMRNPTYLTLGEYQKYRAKQDEDAYWQRRLSGLMLFNKTPELPQMYKEGLFNRIFGGDNISVKPQGNVDVTFGGNWQNIKNPTLNQRAQKYGIFDFDMQMNINLLATVGDKLKLNISNNTKATFDYQNIQKLDYNGKEDEMLKKIEAGNVSFPLKSNLINGVQSLFGLKTQLQFGKLWVTGVLSQQKSQRKSLTIQGGSQSQAIAIKAFNYEENKNFLLGQYFYNNYNKALEKFPLINSLVTINRVEVWVTNRTGAVTGVRDILCFMDLGEANPYQQSLANPSSGIRYGLPDNNTNRLYGQLLQNPFGRQQKSATNAATQLGLTQGQDFERTTARKLSPTEFSFNPQLGYIMLNTQMNPDDVLGVAYRYTYRGRVYQVGEFASDLPPDTTNPKVLFLKLMKGTSLRPGLPVWKLMMKNIYALGGLGVSKENFSLNVMYQDPGGGERRYVPEGPKEGVPFLTVLNLDRLNVQNEPMPDGVFDFAEGITINTQQGKIIFPLLEPFGKDLVPAFEQPGNPNPVLTRKYINQVLYDSTKTIAMQSQQTDRYILRGSYKSSSSSDIFLGGFNIPPGSVSVSAGGTKLVENQDYSMDYGLGRIKILNSGILNSGVPINIQYEDNATFGFQQQNFMGTRLDYYVNRNLTVGGTAMRLTERPFTQQVSFGEDPIKNTVLGLDVNYQKEVEAITRVLDKLPIYSTTSPSFLSTNMEVAALLPGHPKQINALDPEGAVYIDNFEGTSSSYDLKFPAQAWSLAAVPFGATNRFGQVLFPEAAANNQLSSGTNRARLAWYMIEPTLVNPGTTIPKYVMDDPNQHYIRMVQQQDVFPNRQIQSLQGSLATFDLGFYPKERGQYNFDVTNIDPNTGELLNPESRWGGITRSIDNTDFEASNVEFVQFWVMDPFINRTGAQSGSLYINLGNISEDVMKDSRLFFENGVPAPFDGLKLDTTAWGYVPRFEQQITRSFDNDPNARLLQDVGYDGMPDISKVQGQLDEQNKFSGFLRQLRLKLGAGTQPYIDVEKDPSNDNYHYFRGSDYDAANNGDGMFVMARYKRFNSPEGNSPITDPNAAFSTSGTALPESEDLNRDNSLNEAESYFQYRIDFSPNMRAGTNNILSVQETEVKLPNGKREKETWYQFKIPVDNYTSKVGGIADFRSIRFMRMFMSGWKDSAVLRFAELELGRNQWRTFKYSLNTPGENQPQQNQGLTDFTVTSVSLEQNGLREPVHYMLPPGVNRQLTTTTANQTIQMNEQSLSLRTCALQDGDARAVFKEVNVNMRQYTYLRMFIHAESMVGQSPVNNADVNAFLRIGSDFTNNYYEYRMPLAITRPGASLQTEVWPEANEMSIVLQDLVNAKKERDAKGVPIYQPYTTKDSKGNSIIVLGNPNIAGAKNLMLGVVNPKKTNQTPGDDGLPKCSEVWFDELRMAGINDQAGYAAAGKVSVQLADLGNVNVSGSMHTPGYGNIDQKIEQRLQDNYNQYNTSTNLSLGKLLPRSLGITLPLYVGYTQNVSNPKYDPNNADVLVSDELAMAKSSYARDSIRNVTQDFTSITSINLTNVRIQGNPSAPAKTVRMPWSIKNFDFSYSYNNQYKHNPTIESDKLITQRYGMGYTYSLKAKSIEPFKRAIKSKSKWFALAKDINVTPLPSSFTLRNDLNNVYEETQVRNIDDGSRYRIPPLYYKLFTWTRLYTVRWELMRSLSLDYTATNISRIDQPYGKLDTRAKKDSVYDALSRFGRNTSYSQSFNSTYTVPLTKLPITDWLGLRLGYSATYSWTTAPPIAYQLGNTLGNTQTKTASGEMNFKQLYNKSKWLRAIDAPKKMNKPNNVGPKGGGDFSNNNAGKTDKRETRDLRDSAPAGKDKDGKKSKDDKEPGKKADSKSDTSKTDKKPSAKTDEEEELDELKKTFPTIDLGKMSDAQLDSLVEVQKEQDKQKAKAAKKKKKAERKAKRKARRAQVPDLPGSVKIVGRLVTMVNRVSINYTETGGTILPGYMDSTRFMGVNNYSQAPGFDFVYGYQPDYAWLAKQAAADKLSRDTLFNAQFQQTYSRNLNANASVVPFKDFRVDISIQQSFSKSHSELYADTGGGVFSHFNPYETGSFNVSYMALHSMFNNTDVNSSIYKTFLGNLPIISRRLGVSNPYTNGLVDPNDPKYQKGYTKFSQDILIPAFVAAYQGKDANTQALVDYSGKTISSNPFKYFTPLPNWKVEYPVAVARIPGFSQIFSNLKLSHAYTGSLSMNGFTSNLLYSDLYGLGFPSFIDPISGNYVPFFQVPNVTLSQAFNPLIGFDVGFKNNLTGRFEVRKSKMESLSLIDYQISENASTEYVVGFGFRKKGIRLPFKMFGVSKLKNELIMKTEIGVRDDRSSNTFLSNNISIVSRGQKVIRISPTVDYSINQKLTLRFFFDRQQTIPYVSNSYPTTTTRAGVTLRFIFAQ